MKDKRYSKPRQARFKNEKKAVYTLRECASKCMLLNVACPNSECEHWINYGFFWWRLETDAWLYSHLDTLASPHLFQDILLL